MANKDYPNSGAMFARQKRSERAADFSGQFTLDGDVLDYILRCAERGDKVELDISGWKRHTTNSGQMLGLKIELPLAVRQPDRRPQQGGYNRGGGGGSYRSGNREQERYPSRDDSRDARREEAPRRPDMRREMQDDFPEEVQRGPRRSADRDPWDD